MGRTLITNLGSTLNQITDDLPSIEVTYVTMLGWLSCASSATSLRASSFSLSDFYMMKTTTTE